MTYRRLWFTWTLLTAAFVGYLSFAVTVEKTSAKRVLLPGKTTHGHYQIELACDVCHTKFDGVKQDACMNCHAQDLTRETDTHPASKFNDPTNAERLEALDAQSCVTCHREHVPDRTGEMGLSLPSDYCFHCHADVAEQRPSHADMKHDTCQTAGCHNYHDNRALYEKFLSSNCGQPDLLNDPTIRLRHAAATNVSDSSKQYVAADADAPEDMSDPKLIADWVASAHATHGVNCRSCHSSESTADASAEWTTNVSYQGCAECHEKQVEGFERSRHGMRLAAGLSPMTPGLARLPMKEQASHKTMDCSACHQPHDYNTQFAAVDACLACHDDEHSRNYQQSSHFALWKDEVTGNGPAGSGVSCATCHLPRMEGDDGTIFVQHNQNDNLRPNEKMIRSVCMNCHGLEFSLNSLADRSLIEDCFTGQPTVTIDSAQMAKRWFDERAAAKRKRANK